MLVRARAGKAKTARAQTSLAGEVQRKRGALAIEKEIETPIARARLAEHRDIVKTFGAGANGNFHKRPAGARSSRTSCDRGSSVVNLDSHEIEAGVAEDGELGRSHINPIEA